MKAALSIVSLLVFCQLAHAQFPTSPTLPPRGTVIINLSVTFTNGVKLTNAVMIGDSVRVLTYDATGTNAVIDCSLGNHFYLAMSKDTLFKFTNGIPGHWIFLETKQVNGGGHNWFFETNAGLRTLQVSISEQPYLPANTNLGMANNVSFKTSASGRKLYGWQSTGFP